MTEDTKDLTTEEQDEAGRAMVRAALEAFGEFPGNTDKAHRLPKAVRVQRSVMQ